ncbi:MAG TPA: histidine phosphatase family protein [Tepidiformaceae bacterium]|nr:histidine phosphatase family protein [Tepidiformaceae bacterium]
MAVQLVFETHSTTADNEAGIATGWLPGDLSLVGRQNARDLGVRRRHDGLAAVYLSDLARAVETATIAFEGSSIPLYQDARLRECNYGQLDGTPSIGLNRRSHIVEPFPGGQSYRDVTAQMAAFLHDIQSRHEGERILLISHSANRWALEHLLNNIPLEDLIDAPFEWQEGWEFTLPADWD